MSALFVHHLTVIDFSYLDPQRGLLGESWIVDLELHGDLDDQGMVFDFGPVKKLTKQAIDGLADHKLLVPTKMAGLSISQSEQDDLIQINWQNAQYPFAHSSPAEAVLFLDCEQITPDALLDKVRTTVADVVPSNVKEIRIHLYPETIEGAFYHYSHGLKKHLGDCQRIAHGHRSKLIVKRNGKRDAQLEAKLSNHFEDIYLATKEDIVKETEVAGINCYQFGYTSEQGQFEITLPKDTCYLLETDTTVELIAQALAELAKSEVPDDDIEVIAYEGVNKGAIAKA